MNFKEIFKNRKFLTQIGISILVTVVIMWIAGMLLGFFTHHSQAITVPDLTGLKMEDLESYLSEKHLDYKIIDSVYNSNGKRGTVISQDPYPNSTVKSGRKIYVTVIAKLPERTTMPDLKDLTLRQAMAVLETYGLKVGKLQYIADIAKNAVLKQTFKGNTIESGAMIMKGSAIDLVIGRGTKNEKASIPYLLGKSRAEAIKMINQYSLNVGAENFEDGADTSNARVYRQSPAFSKKAGLSLGSSINIWYKSDKKFDFNSFLKKHKNDTIENEE